jgi:dihydroorotate dehydrogenase (NAD+) catalytic subunit
VSGLRVGGVELAHPVLNASGTLDAPAARDAGVPVHDALAALVTKTVTPQPREGNDPPRLAEAPAGLLNSIGLANPGLEAFAERVLPATAALGRPLVVSVGGFSHDDYAAMVRRLAGAPGVVALELNVSCPNVESGCISIGSDAAETRALVERVRPLSGVPLWVKLSPNVADVGAIAAAAEAGGADAVVACNTLRGMAVDRGSLRPLLGGVTGGLSGPALRPVALACVHACRAACGLDVVGVGGVGSGQDALELMAAGAAAVQVGTATFPEPRAAERVRRELEQLLASRRDQVLPQTLESWSRVFAEQPSTVA